MLAKKILGVSGTLIMHDCIAVTLKSLLKVVVIK